MREIKFRGKDKTMWHFGFLDYRDTSIQIHVVEDIPPTMESPCGDLYSEYFTVIPETVGQFTGLQDSKGVDIYEGDLVNCVGLPSGKIGNARKMLGKVVQRTMGWTICVKYKKEWWHYSKMSYLKEELEVIGNIHTEVKK